MQLKATISHPLDEQNLLSVAVPGTGNDVEQCTAGDNIWRWNYFGKTIWY